MAGSEEGRGFRRLGQPNLKNTRPENVVPFDADRVNRAIEKAALRLEHERMARTKPAETVPEPTPEDIHPIADEVLAETLSCDLDLSIDIAGKLLQATPDLRSYMKQLQNMTEDDLTTDEEYWRAVAMNFKQLDAARKRGDHPEV